MPLLSRLPRPRKLHLAAFVAALAASAGSSAWAQDPPDEEVDCCGPRSSACCPGKIITGGALGQAAEMADEITEANDAAVSGGNHKTILGKGLYELMKALGYGAEASKPSESKVTVPQPTVEAVFAALYNIKPGTKITGTSGSGNEGDKYVLVMKKRTNKPFERTFSYKPGKGKTRLLITLTKTKTGLSLTWK